MNWEEAVAKFQPQTREEAFELGILVGFQNAIDALNKYREDSEEVTACLHSREWAMWLEKNRGDILGC